VPPAGCRATILLPLVIPDQGSRQELLSVGLETAMLHLIRIVDCNAAIILGFDNRRRAQEKPCEADTLAGLVFHL